MRVLTRDETGDVNLLASGQPERQRARGHARVQRREHQCARSVWKGVLGCTFTGWGGSVQTRAPVGSWVATFYRQPIWYWPYALVRTFGRLAVGHGVRPAARRWPAPWPRRSRVQCAGRILSMATRRTSACMLLAAFQGTHASRAAAERLGAVINNAAGFTISRISSRD
jgi:hypothetical protein